VPIFPTLSATLGDAFQSLKAVYFDCNLVFASSIKTRLVLKVLQTVRERLWRVWGVCKLCVKMLRHASGQQSLMIVEFPEMVILPVDEQRSGLPLGLTALHGGNICFSQLAGDLLAGDLFMHYGDGRSATVAS